MIEPKYVYIGGGVVIVGGLLFFVRRLKAATTATTAANNAAAQQASYSGGLTSPGVLYSPAPISGGTSSPDLPAAVSASNNIPIAGSVASPSISDILNGLVSSSNATATDRIAANQHVADSSILSGINFGSAGGDASLTHSANGTTLSVTASDPNTAFLTSEYQNILGRAPDAGGLAFWLDAIRNGHPLTEIDQGIKNSAEAKARQPA